MKCPECQYENRKGVKFCEGCGTRMPTVCPKCGSEVGPQARFCGECGAKLMESISDAESRDQSTRDLRLEDMQEQLRSRVPQSLADKMLADAEQMQGEYRRITAIFADVVGSSEMARNMPLEQYVEVMNDCLKTMVDTISIRYEGIINRFIGDCVLAFFGVPITHENDAERAILAALDIRDSLKKLGLGVSIGINTGMTYVGEMGSDLIYAERSAWGPDVDFAKRLQVAATPGEIWVGTSTYRLTSRAFDFMEPVYFEVKETEKRQIAYPVLRIRQHPEKLRGIEGLEARMIGREKEFADLKEAAADLILGKGNIVCIIGEPGLGKSRLASELKRYLKDEDVICYEGRSISMGQPVSYRPFLDILRTHLNLSDADSESDVARKLKESTMDLFPQRWRDILPFLGRVLPVRFGNDLDGKLAYSTPEQVKHQTLMCLRDTFIAISHRRPLLLILDDLNWADDLSLDLVSLLMDELAENPLMLLCIYRWERDHRCSQISDVASRKCPERYTQITLNKLSRIDSYELVESLLEMRNFPKAARNAILEKSEGNPFFIEEVTRSLMERGLVYREDGKWKARGEIGYIDVPDTVQSVLLSRVDRLEAGTKYILQCASVIGRLFRHKLLAHLLQHDSNLEEHLSQLEERELIYEERAVPEVEYAFKHALTQEATYQGILERKRRELHQLVADGIEELYRERIEDFYEELAHHHKLGGNDEKAMEYLLKSGIKAAGQFASQDALRYLDQAEELLERFRGPCRKERAALYEKRGEVLQWIGRWTEAVKEYKEALRWCDDPRDRAEIYRKIAWLESEEIQDKASAMEYLKLGLRELPEDDMSVQRIRLEHDMAWVEGVGLHLCAEGLRRCQQTTKMAEEMGYRRELAILCAYTENLQSCLGTYSDEYGQKAIDIAEGLGDPPTLAWVYYIVANTRQHIRNGSHWTQQSIPYYLRAMEICERIGDTQTLTMTLVWLGVAYKELGQDEKAIENWEKALQIAVGTKSIFPLLSVSGLMGIYGERGQADMVRSTFSRIMHAFASLELDEESQARTLFMGGGEGIYIVYQSFRDGYRAMGEEPGFSTVAREILEDSLSDVHSRPQQAWYHTELMNLYMELGDMRSAESHAKAVISIIDQMGHPDCMTRFYPPYLLLGDTRVADELVCRFLDKNLLTGGLDALVSEVELMYHKLGQTEAFQQLSERIEREYGDKLTDSGVARLD